MNIRSQLLKLGLGAVASLALLALPGYMSGVTSASAAKVDSPVQPTANWTRQTTRSEALDMVALDQNHVWASHTFGMVLRTSDGGVTWQEASVGDSQVILQGIDMADMLNGWTVGERASGGGRAYRTTDGGVTWVQQNPTSQRLFSVAAINPQTAIAVGGGTSFTVALRTTDGGATWATLDVPLNDGIFLDVYFINSTTGWITGLDGGIAKTTDGGNTWLAQSHPINWGMADIHFSDPNNGWAGGYFQMLLHTTDGGNTWTQQNPAIPDRTHVLAVQAISPQEAWIAGYGGGAQSRPFVKYTTDGGTTWIDHTPAVGPYDSFSSLAFLNADYGWAGGYVGIFRHGAMTCAPDPDYRVTSATGATIVPGTSLVPGSTCNSCAVNVPLPFAYSFYGTSYTSVSASNKGTLQFTGSNSSGANTCIPVNGLTDAIMAYWDDLNTNINDNMGIYTRVMGSAPNRTFIIEWRAGYVANDATANFEVILYEGQPKFDVVYGNVTRRGFSATIGVQQGNGSQHATQYACDTANTVQPGLRLTFDQRDCQ